MGALSYTRKPSNSKLRGLTHLIRVVLERYKLKELIK